MATLSKDGPAPAGKNGLALLIGPAVTTVFRVRDGRLELPGTTLPRNGAGGSAGPAAPAQAGPHDEPVLAVVVAGTGVPRVTIDGRSSLNPGAVRVAGQTLLEVGATLAGPVLSDAAATDLFVHELARQRPDILLLTQPIAGDKLRALSRLLREAPLGGSPLDIIYVGPAGYQHKPLEGLAGCSYTAVDGKAAAGSLEIILRERLAPALAGRGLGSAAFVAAGRAATRAVTTLAGLFAGVVAPENGRGRAGGSNGDLWAETGLFVVEPDGAAAYLHLPQGARAGRAAGADRASAAGAGTGAGLVEAASASFTGTGTVDLIRAGKSGPAEGGAEGWLPAWDALAQRLPLPMDPVDVGNLAGASLVRPWAPPASLGEACLEGALAEALLARLVQKWPLAVRRETSPARCRIIVGTGYGLARLGDARHAAYTLVNGLQPGGVTAVAVDLWGTCLFDFDGLERPRPELAAVVVSPLRAELDWAHAGSDPWAIVTLEREGGQTAPRRLIPGRVTAIPLAPGEKARLIVEPCRPKLDFGAGPGRVWRGTVEGSATGVILDGRGRPYRPAADAGLRTARQREFLAAFGILDGEVAR